MAIMLVGNIRFMPAGVVLVDVDGSNVTLLASDALWLAEEIEKHRKELEEAASHQQEKPSHEQSKKTERQGHAHSRI